MRSSLASLVSGMQPSRFRELAAQALDERQVAVIPLGGIQDPVRRQIVREEAERAIRAGDGGGRS